MKKLFITLALLVTGVMTLSGCTDTANVGEKEPIAYALLMHEDGEERIEVVSYQSYNGTIMLYDIEGRHIVSNNITIIEY